MYYYLREMFWWEGLNKDKAEFVAKSPNCQQVKDENQNPYGLLQEMQVPTFKWEDINMNFVVGFPRTPKQYDSILVNVYRLTNSAHFIPVKSTYSVKNYARIFIDEIGCRIIHYIV